MTKKLIAVFLFVTIIPISICANANSDLEIKKAELENKLNESLNELNNTIKTQAQLSALVQNLDSDLQNIQEEISLEETRLISAEIKLSSYENLYNLQFEEYADYISSLQSQISSLVQTNGTFIQNLYSNDLYAFKIKNQSTEEIFLSGQSKLETLRQALSQTSEDKQVVSKAIDEINFNISELYNKKSEIYQTYSENQTALAEINIENSKNQESFDKISLEYNEVTNMIDEIAIKEQEEAVLGDNAILTMSQHSFLDALWPVPDFGVNWITSYWGDGRNHKGIDIAAYYGEEVVASESGYVVSSYFDNSWGKNVLISHNDIYDTRYAHLSSYIVSPNDYVEKGQVIGYIGSTGNSTGNHLHFEVYFNSQRVDPFPYLQK